MTARAPAERLRVIVAGMVAAVPHQGGATWAVLQYALGVRSLGHEVLLLDEVPADPPEDTGLAARRAAYFNDVVRGAGLEGAASMIGPGSRATVGLPFERARSFARTADVVLNLSGTLTGPELLGHAAVRVWVDLDPAFNQMWAHEGTDLGFEGHTHFATVGLNVGARGNTIPTCGREWIPTLPPVLLERWPRASGPAARGLTTVANWRSYGPVERDGVRYGQKAHSIRELVDLPARTAVPVEIALAIHPGDDRDLDLLTGAGWNLLDPASVAGTPEAYHRFVGESWAELGIAKHGYVVSRSGWFGDRSACYLASGRPVLAQDTGFASGLPTGQGLLTFGTAEEAADGIEAIAADHDRHRSAAREIAESHLDARRVLSALLDRVTGADLDPMATALGKALGERLGGSVVVVGVARSPSEYRSSFALEDVDVTLDEDVTLALVAKDLSPASMSEPARRSKPTFLVDPLREVEAYSSLLEGARLGTAAWYGSAAEPASGRHWLFLERVGGVGLDQVGAFDVWLDAARWLARMHSTFAPRVVDLDANDRLVRYDAAMFARWARRAAALATARDLPTAERQRLMALLEAYPGVLDRFDELPRTLVHGDFYPANVLVVPNGDRPRVCPLDWELAGVGPGLLDLAALSTGGWGEGERDALITTYADGLAERGVAWGSPDELRLGFERCRLHVCVQWLGWSNDWSPPAQQANDWTAEAFATAERLGLL